jgi:hypothetical protein
MDEDQDMEGGVAANGLDAEGYLRGTWCLQSKRARVRLTVCVPARQLLRIKDEDPVKFNTEIKPALSPPGQPFNESGWALLRRRVLAADAFGPDGLLRNEPVSLPREITHEDMTNGTADPQVSRLVVRPYILTLNPRVQPFEPRSRSLNGTTDRCILTSQPRTRSAEDTLVSPAKRPHLAAHSNDGQGPNESAVGLVVARPGTPHPATGQFSFEPNAASSAILATKTRGSEPYWVTTNSVLQQHLRAAPNAVSAICQSFAYLIFFEYLSRGMITTLDSLPPEAAHRFQPLMLRLAHEQTQRPLPSCKWLVKISKGDQDQALRGARQFDSAEGVSFEPYFAEHSHKLLRGIHERDNTVYPRDFLLVPVDSPFDFYIPAGQRRMVETAEHKAALHQDCPDIAQLHPPGTWAFPYFVNRLTWKPQLELASAVKREEADGESSPLRNNIVLTLEYYPESRVWIEDPCEVPAEAAGMELDNDVDVLNNTGSTTTPCTSGVNTPELTNDCGTDSADKAALSNNERALAGPANLDVQANGARPKRVLTT